MSLTYSHAGAERKALVPYIFAKSNAPQTRNSQNVAGDATGSVLATVTLPPGLLSGHTSIFVYALWRVTSSANVKTLTTKLGGTSFGNHSPTTNISNQTALFIHADNAANDQKLVNNAVAGMTGAGSTMIDQSKDCSVAIDITFECNWAGAIGSGSIVLESYRVWVFPGQ